MAISVDWGTRVITVPKADMTLIQSNPFEVRELDLDVFRLALKALEDDEIGMAFPDTHQHNTEIVLAGATYARTIQIINGYTVTFEDGQYAVNLVGANSNVSDVLNLNQVSVRSFNSAGLIVVAGGSGSEDWSSAEKEQIRQALGVAGSKTPTSSGNLDDLMLRITAERAAKLDNLDTTISSRAQPGDAMTLTVGERNAIAGAVLVYDMGNGRTVIQALASARNRWRITGTSNPYTYEVYDTDDSSVLWSAQVTITAGGEVKEIVPV